MTKEEKDLLFIDLSARVPYVVKGKLYLFNSDKHIIEAEIEGCLTNNRILIKGNEHDFPIDWFKPYLRPLSSITDEEAEEFEKLSNKLLIDGDNVEIWAAVTDWLNSHHFDYRGLIEKGLALVAPENMYKI